MNDFEKCNKKEYEDGFCKLCFNEQKSDKRTGTAKPDKRWKRDGIYGEPYDFELLDSIQIKRDSVLKFCIATKPSINEKSFFMNEHTTWKKKEGVMIPLHMLSDVIKEFLATASPFTSGSSSVYKSPEELR